MPTIYVILSVVAGIRTPEPIAKLKDTLPRAYDELMENVNILEKYYKDMQDIEFTVQEVCCEYGSYLEFIII